MDWTTYAMRVAPLMGALAIVAGGLCAGTLASVSWIAHRARWMADGPEIGRLALELFYRRTLPFLFLGLAGGTACLYGVGLRSLQTSTSVGVSAAAGLLVMLVIVVAWRARKASTGV
ncbi:MAG TPA: hypothetical protein VGL81_12430 [Polyangiaceae bacterium]|jgi:hypothetical protein